MCPQDPYPRGGRSLSARKRLVLLCVIGIVTISVSLTGAAEPTVLTVFTNGSVEYLESTRLFFDEVERQHPDLRFNIETGGLDKFLVMYSAGVVPDLLRLYGQNVPEYAARGLIQPLQPYMDKSSLKPQDFLPVLVERSLSYNGEIYSLSWGMSVTSLFVNEDRFNAAGIGMPDESWHWETEGVEAARKLSQDNNSDGTIDHYFLNHIGTGTNASAFVYMGGGEIFDTEMNYVGDTAETVETLEFVYDLMTVNNAMPTPTRGGGPWDLPSHNTSAFITGSWYVSALLRQQVGFEWDIALIPSLNGRRGTSIWPETPWAIPANAAHPDLSWRVMEFIGSREGQTLATGLGLAMPPLRLDVAQSAFMDEYPDLSTGSIIEMTLADLTKTIPTAPTSARQPWYDALAAFLRGEISARQAVDRARVGAQAAVEEFRKNIVVQ